MVNPRWTKYKNGWMKVWVNGIERVANTGKKKGCGNEVYFKYGVYRTYISLPKLSKTVTTTPYYDGVVRSKSLDGMFEPLSE